MPRRTRRSEEPSAAAQSDVDNEASPSSDSAVDPTPAETHARPASTRRRSPAKPVDTATQDANDAEAPSATPEEPLTSRPRRRRPPRASAVPASTAAANTMGLPNPDVAAEELLEPQTEGSTEETPAVAVNAEPQVVSPAGRRRVGGRRSAVEAAAAIASDSVPGEPPSVIDANPRPSRNRRRRGGNRTGEAAAEATPPIEDIPGLDVDSGLIELPIVADPSTADSVGTDEEQRRSRRSRRGGRRRSGKSTDSEKSAELEPELPEEPIEDDDPLVPLFKPIPIWKAPLLVPHPSDRGLSQTELKVSVALSEDYTGFIVNNEYFGPELFFVNAETADDSAVVSSEIAFAAGIGLHLHSGAAYLPLKNAYGNRSFSSIDTLLTSVLDADPVGYVVIRLQLVPTNFWARTNPEEMAKYSDGSDGDVSFASSIFWEDAIDAISALVAHLADPATVGGDRVIGIHLDKGEWFNDANAGYDLSAPNKLLFQSWLHEHYQNVFALRAAWFNGAAQFETAEIPKWPGVPNSRKREEVVLYNQPRERKFIDYNLYTSDVMAQAITGVAKAVKWLTQGKLLVGTSYGYTFEFAVRNDSGHQALGKILASPDIDIIAGPNSYATRGAGAAGGFGSPVDSAAIHGKLWLVEDDTKTHLAADETEDSFNPKVATSNDTLSVLRRNSGAASVHGCGIIWMDLWGKGWLNSPEVWSEIAELRSQAVVSRRMKLNDRSAACEVAVLVDEASYAYIRGDSSGVNLQTALINKSRELLYRSGAAVAFYLQSDVANIPDKVKLYIFLNAVRVTTTERQAIREKLQTQGKTLVWIYGPGVFDERGESPAEVTEIVGMPLKPQPWNSHIGTLFTEERHPITERLHGGKKLGTDDVLNPSYAVVDPAAIALGEFMQSGAASIASKINEGGWKSVFIGEPHLTGELLRGLYRFAGVHVYDGQDDIVHAIASGLLLIHAPYTGQRTIHLPKPSAVYSVYEHRLVTQQSSTFRVFMRGRSSNFFLWGDIEQIASVLGTTAGDLREQQAAWKADRESSQNRNPRSNDSPKEDGSDDSDNDSDFTLNEEGEILAESLGSSDGGLDPIAPLTGAVLNEVDMLVKSGLIADSDAILVEVADDGDLDDTLVGNEPLVATARQNEPMSPSRRRRWNRKRNMQAAKEPGAPTISVEDLLSDLPPRRTTPPKQEE